MYIYIMMWLQACGGQGVGGGGLNENDLHRCIGSGAIRRHRFVGGRVSLGKGF